MTIEEQQIIRDWLKNKYMEMLTNDKYKHIKIITIKMMIDRIPPDKLIEAMNQLINTLKKNQTNQTDHA